MDPITPVSIWCQCLYRYYQYLDWSTTGAHKDTEMHNLHICASVFTFIKTQKHVFLFFVILQQEQKSQAWRPAMVWVTVQWRGLAKGQQPIKNYWSKGPRFGYSLIWSMWFNLLLLCVTKVHKKGHLSSTLAVFEQLLTSTVMVSRSSFLYFAHKQEKRS